MKIYLDNKLLIQSEVFGDPNLEANKRERNTDNCQREWNIYTWNSKNRLSFKEDGTSALNKDTVEANLREYKIDKTYEEFKIKEIPAPDYVIEISGYFSLIKTSKKTVEKIIKKLEKEKIDCLLNNITPIIENADYISKRLNKQIKKY